MADQQKKLQSLSDAYQKLQTDLQSVISARQKLESQQQENKGVQKEFSKLAPSSNIYKLVGRVLLKQERSEAVMAVDGRLEFIEREIKRLEKQIQDMENESEGKKMEVCFGVSHRAWRWANEDIASLSAADADAAGSAVKMTTARRAILPLSMTFRQESRTSREIFKCGLHPVWQYTRMASPFIKPHRSMMQHPKKQP